MQAAGHAWSAALDTSLGTRAWPRPARVCTPKAPGSAPDQQDLGQFLVDGPPVEGVRRDCPPPGSSSPETPRRRSAAQEAVQPRQLLVPAEDDEHVRPFDPVVGAPLVVSWSLPGLRRLMAMSVRP